MKPTPVFVAAAGFAMLGACKPATQDNTAQNMDSNSAMTANESVLPATDSDAANAAGTDTLGNQLNQLNADEGANSAGTANVASNQQ